MPVSVDKLPAEILHPWDRRKSLPDAKTHSRPAHSHWPRLPGQEAFVQVGLYTFQLRVVLGCIQERLRAFRFRQFGKPGVLQLRAAFEGGFTLVGELLGAEFVQHKGRIVVAQDAAFLPFHLTPGRVTQGDVESSAVGEDVGEGQFPVEEAVVFTQLVGDGQSVEEGVFEQFFQVEFAALVADFAGGFCLGGFLRAGCVGVRLRQTCRLGVLRTGPFALL